MFKAIVGLNWGDEGKGRMVDYMAAQADCVIRYQGGDNAGHTVVNDFGKFALHNIPCGIFYQDVVNIIAPGSVLNPESFIKEITELQSRNIPTDKVFISDRAILILPFHPLLDQLEDQRLKDKRYGSTMSGIAPVYGDKYMKKGIQAGELLHPEYLKEHLTTVVDFANLRLEGVYGQKRISVEEIYNWLMQFADKIKPHIIDIQPLISQYLKEDKNVILEAQLGALRDITHGIYPYTTSSSTLAGYACSSIPVPAQAVKEVIGITKAYSTCVGEGAFVSEIHSALAEHIREKGHEYGAKTGRPRRVGHFDAVATQYGCFLQGATGIAMTCLDVLDELEELQICTSYEIDGVRTVNFPLYPGLLKAKPVYETLPGWKEDITGVRKYEDLPLNARKYIERIEEICGLPIQFVSVGPDREALIVR